MNLRTPGPIPVTDDVLEAMAGPMINHRGPEFKDILYRVTDRLKRVFETDGDVYILTSSGTGAMEAAVANTLSPADEVLCVSVGVFGERFGQIAEIYGADVSWLKFPVGEAVDPDRLRELMEGRPDLKAVLVTQNETSTGVMNDMEAIGAVVKGEFDKLLLVDGISSVCSLPLRTDAWGCDAVATASQKGWGLPPGLAFLSFSEQAWEAHSRSTMPRYYFDMAEYRRSLEMGQTPYTPALSQIFALDLVLGQLLDEGMGAVFERHRSVGQFVRDGVRSLGLSILPDESVASDTVTAVRIPDGVDAAGLLTKMRVEHDVVLAGGQQDLAGKIFRIGHMGRCDADEIQQVFDALSIVLPAVGYKA